MEGVELGPSVGVLASGAVCRGRGVCRSLPVELTSLARTRSEQWMKMALDMGMEGREQTAVYGEQRARARSGGRESWERGWLPDWGEL